METKLHTPLARGLKRARKDKGLSQPELAEIMGRDVKTIRNWEQDVCKPEVNNLYKLQELYGCDMAYLFGEIEGKTYDVNFIMEKTGLSEDAVQVLIGRKEALPEGHVDGFIDMLNYLITEGRSLIEAINDYRTSLIYMKFARDQFIEAYNFDEEIISGALKYPVGLTIGADRSTELNLFAEEMKAVLRGRQLTDDELGALYRYSQFVHGVNIRAARLDCTDQLGKILSAIDDSES